MQPETSREFTEEDLPIRNALQLLRAAFGSCSEAELKLLLKDKSLQESVRSAVNGAFDGRPSRGMINDLFTPAKMQLDLMSDFNFEGRCGLDSRFFDAARANTPPWPKGEFSALVLVPTLRETRHKSSLQRTFQALMRSLGLKNHEVYRASDRKSLKLADNIPPLVEGLTWHQLDLGCRPNSRWREIMTEGNLPHLAVLAAAVMHPHWLRKMFRYEGVTSAMLPGLTWFDRERPHEGHQLLQLSFDRALDQPDLWYGSADLYDRPEQRQACVPREILT